jgi:hypothetical protein
MHPRLPFFFTLAAVVGAGVLLSIDLPGGGRTAAAQSAPGRTLTPEKGARGGVIARRTTDQHGPAAARCRTAQGSDFIDQKQRAVRQRSSGPTVARRLARQPSHADPMPTRSRG